MQQRIDLALDVRVFRNRFADEVYVAPGCLEVEGIGNAREGGIDLGLAPAPVSEQLRILAVLDRPARIENLLLHVVHDDVEAVHRALKTDLLTQGT